MLVQQSLIHEIFAAWAECKSHPLLHHYARTPEIDVDERVMVLNIDETLVEVTFHIVMDPAPAIRIFCEMEGDMVVGKVVRESYDTVLVYKEVQS